MAASSATALTLLYFAAASFTETAWRLGRPEIAGGFLLHDHPHFGPQSRSCVERAMQRPARAERTQLIRQIHRTIKPFDVAGLGRRDRRNWYPVDAGDLLRAAGKLGASRQEVEALLRRSGFVAERSA